MIKINKHFERCKREIIDIIRKVLPDCKIYLFGSRARGDNDAGADVDIALDNKKPINQNKISLILDKLEESTMPLMVDMVDLQSASDKFKEEIKNERVLWEN